MQNKKYERWIVDLMANNKKSVLFTIDEDVYYQLRYKKKNMSAHVNWLIRQSVFEDNHIDLSPVKTIILLSVLEGRYEHDSFLQTIFKREKEKLWDNRKTTSSDRDEVP